MPIYEYRCNTCNSKSSHFFRSVSPASVPVCPACGGTDMSRVMSGFAYHRSEQTRFEESGEPKMVADADYYKDPRNIGRWAEKRMKEMGVEMPSEIRQMIDRAREGDLPEPVKDL